MISPSAREAFEFFTVQAIKGALPASSDDRCEVTVLEDASRVQGQRLVILTVSSSTVTSQRSSLEAGRAPLMA